MHVILVDSRNTFRADTANVLLEAFQKHSVSGVAGIHHQTCSMQ